MTMRRLSLRGSLVFGLGLAVSTSAAAKPVKRRPVRHAPAAAAPAPAIDDAPAPPTPDEAAPAPHAQEESSAKPAAAPADEAPAPKAESTEAPAKPADEAPAPPPSSIDLKKLRADYDRLRDDLFRSRSRAQIVQEGVWNARLAGELRWKAAPDYVIRHAELRLDGGTIWDSGDHPVTDDKLAIAERPCKPGPHTLTVRLEVRPGTKKKGKDIEGLGYTSEQTFAIVVPDGKRTTVAVTGDEDGSLPEYEPELELELESEPLKK
jgi:hypothetical protein